MRVAYFLQLLAHYAIVNINCQSPQHPIVVLEKKDWTTDRGMEIKMFCDSIGYPLPTIKWTHTQCYDFKCHDDQAREYDSIYVHNISSTHQRHELNVRALEEGFMTCEGSNAVGTNESIGLITFLINNNNETLYIEDGLSEHSYTTGANVSITCVMFEANFDVTLEWYRPSSDERFDGFLSKNDTNSTKGIEYRNELHWPSISLDDKDLYQCRKRYEINNFNYSVNITIDVRDYSWLIDDVLKPIFFTSIFVVPFCLCLFSIYTCFCFEKRTERKLLAKLKASFNAGNPDGINPDKLLNEQGDLLPYDQTFEFPREQLTMGKQLGAGAFGIVMKAKAQGIQTDDGETLVAVKMVKSNCTHESLRSLISELKILIHLGKHLNVVNLLGAVTDNLNNSELMVIVEYCKYGNVQTILRMHRRQFIDQINRADDSIDPSISNRSTDDEEDTESIDECLAADESVAADGAPAQVRECIPNNYTNMTKETAALTISTTDLVSWSFQVASGMQYLSSRNVLHGDLAARNILLCESNVVKICDFGLSRPVQQDCNYRKTSDTPLPFKWLALEAFSEQIFNTHTDVWSFGVLMWELFSLGEAPYPGMEADEQLLMKIRDGYRMAKPDFSTQEIYEIMLACWKVNPVTRPSFSALEQHLSHILGAEKSDHYNDMNETYLQVNAARFGSGGANYVTSVAVPVDTAPPPPPPEQLSQYVNISHSEGGSAHHGYAVVKAIGRSIYETTSV